MHSRASHCGIFFTLKLFALATVLRREFFRGLHTRVALTLRMLPLCRRQGHQLLCCRSLGLYPALRVGDSVLRVVIKLVVGDSISSAVSAGRWLRYQAQGCM